MLKMVFSDNDIFLTVIFLISSPLENCDQKFI